VGKIQTNDNLNTGGISSPVDASTEVDTVNFPDDVIAPASGEVERLGAAYCIKASLPYHDQDNWQPTRASEFYGWTGGR
jgi:hypothetical protein